MASQLLAETVPLLEHLLEERGGFATFAFGFGIVLFTSIATGAAAIANAVCSASLLTAMFGGAFVGAGPCIAAGATSVLAASIAGGITSYGASIGWAFEGASAGIGKRHVFEPFVDNAFGVTHHYDAETHRILNQTYGDMLDSHNTTLLSVTWLETLPNANHTGRQFELLNMTNGRIVTLHDNGIIRTVLGQTTTMGQILESFNDFKGTNSTTDLLKLKKRQWDGNAADWLSFNTYGENMEEGSQNYGNVQSIYTELADQGDDGYETNFIQAESGEFQSKFCLAASPAGNSAGENSIIVGEVYVNQWGGIDSGCDSG